MHAAVKRTVQRDKQMCSTFYTEDVCMLQDHHKTFVTLPIFVSRKEVPSLGQWANLLSTKKKKKIEFINFGL